MMLMELGNCSSLSYFVGIHIARCFSTWVAEISNTYSTTQQAILVYNNTIVLSQFFISYFPRRWKAFDICCSLIF